MPSYLLFVSLVELGDWEGRAERIKGKDTEKGLLGGIADKQYGANHPVGKWSCG